MLPRFSSRDPIVSGEYKEWNGWLWWVWEFYSGWCEWVPAYVMLVHLISESSPQLTNAQLDRLVRATLLKLHRELEGDLIEACFAGEADSFEEGMWMYINGQRNYTALEKSSWYYSSLPEHSGPAAETCFFFFYIKSLQPLQYLGESRAG